MLATKTYMMTPIWKQGIYVNSAHQCQNLQDCAMFSGGHSTTVKIIAVSRKVSGALIF